MSDTTATAGSATGRAFADAQRQALRALAALLDHLLRQQPEGRRRLLPHAGKTLELRAGSLGLRVRVSEDARLLPLEPGEPGEREDAAPALRLDVDVARWLSAQLRGGAEAALGGVRIAGDAEFAQAVSWLLGHLRWDAEADLSRVVGDVVAHRAARAAGAAAARARSFARRAESDAREWLREGPRGVVGRWELQAAAGDVARLRDAAARLEKRVDAVRRRLHGT